MKSHVIWTILYICDWLVCSCKSLQSCALNCDWIRLVYDGLLSTPYVCRCRNYFVIYSTVGDRSFKRSRQSTVSIWDNVFSLKHCYHSWQPGKAPTWWKIFVMICVYCFNCTKFGLLILRKIIKMVATRCHILRLKCTKFDFQIAFCADLLCCSGTYLLLYWC